MNRGGVSRHGVSSRVSVTVLVAAWGDTTSPALAATRGALDGLVAQGHRIEYLLVNGRCGETWDQALHRARGSVIAYVEPGFIPSLDWLAGLDAAWRRRPHVAAIAAQVVDTATGDTVDRPAGLTFDGHPLADASPAKLATRTMILGRAWTARRDRIERIGGFDHRTSMPYGLIDLAWRTWLCGDGAIFDPEFTIGLESIAATGTASAPGDADELARDSLVTIYRNLDDRNLEVALPAALRLDRHRRHAHGNSIDDALEYAVDDEVAAERRDRQGRRMRPDAEVTSIFGGALHPESTAPEYVDAHAKVVGSMGADHTFGGRFRVAIVTADALGKRMAGPGIRAMKLAGRLAQDHEVRVASTTSAEIDDPRFEIGHVAANGFAALIDWCDIFVFQGWVLAGNPLFQRPDRIFMVDVYDPIHLEQLEQARDLGEFGRHDALRRATAMLNEQLARGDSFFCASDKQRDFWLGQMAALGRVNSVVYDEDPSLDSLITVVPFGISDEPPVRTRPALKGVVPGIGNDDRVILWGGGVYNWFDPLTLIHAVDRLRTRCDDVRLVFLGMRHPNPDIPEMRMAVETRRLAERLGLVGTHVFFNEEWVAYDDRQNYLLDADVAVTTHLHHVETEFSFRTRVLDYFWAGLPTVATSGDALADLIDQRRLGLTVPPGDVEALSDALERLLEDREFNLECRENIVGVRSSFLWSNVLEPVAARCRDPRRAPDLVAGIVQTDPGVDLGGRTLRTGLMRDLRVGYAHLRNEGPAVVVEKVRNRINRRFR